MNTLDFILIHTPQPAVLLALGVLEALDLLRLRHPHVALHALLVAVDGVPIRADGGTLLSLRACPAARCACPPPSPSSPPSPPSALGAVLSRFFFSSSAFLAATCAALRAMKCGWVGMACREHEMRNSIPK